MFIEVALEHLHANLDDILDLAGLELRTFFEPAPFVCPLADFIRARIAFSNLVRLRLTLVGLQFPSRL